MNQTVERGLSGCRGKKDSALLNEGAGILRGIRCVTSAEPCLLDEVSFGSWGFPAEAGDGGPKQLVLLQGEVGVGVDR